MLCQAYAMQAEMKIARYLDVIQRKLIPVRTRIFLTRKPMSHISFGLPKVRITEPGPARTCPLTKMRGIGAHSPGTAELGAKEIMYLGPL